VRDVPGNILYELFEQARAPVYISYDVCRHVS
jgi:hypothetical protein